MEGSPNVTIKSYYGQSDVCRINHTPNVPGGMGDGHGLTAYQQRLQRTTRSNAMQRNTTSRRPPATLWRQAPRGRKRQPIPAGSTIPARPQDHTNVDKPKRGLTPKNQSAHGPPPCKRLSHFGKSNLPGVQCTHVRFAGTPKIPRQHREINNLLEQHAEGMRLVRMPPEVHRRPCATRQDHQRLCQCSL
jgi:hypothetical protein